MMIIHVQLNREEQISLEWEYNCFSIRENYIGHFYDVSNLNMYFNVNIIGIFSLFSGCNIYIYFFHMCFDLVYLVYLVDLVYLEPRLSLKLTIWVTRIAVFICVFNCTLSFSKHYVHGFNMDIFVHSYLS